VRDGRRKGANVPPTRRRKVRVRRGLLAGVALVAALSILACAGSTRPSNKPCDPAHLCPTPSPTLAPNPSATPTPASSPGPSGSTTYTFDDEFNGTALSSAWSGDRPSIGGQEASFGLSQATVANGLLTHQRDPLGLRLVQRSGFQRPVI